MRRIVLGVLVASSPFLAGCGCARVAPPPSSPPNAEAALQRMHASFACANAVQAAAKIDHFGDKARVRADLLLFAARPASIRMDVVGPMNVGIVATLTSDSSRFALADLRDKRFFFGPASACNIARLTTVPVPAHVLVGLLRGEAPVLAHAPETASMAWDDDGFWVLSIESTRGARETIRLAPAPDDWRRPWQQQRMRVLEVSVEQQGYVLYRAELRDHTRAPTAGPREDPDALPGEAAIPPSGPPCDAEVPRRIHVEVPDPEADVRFQYEQVTWNPPLPQGTFEQPVPAGMRVEHVTCAEP